MDPLGSVKGKHKLVTLEVPGRAPTRALCLVREDASGADSFYVLAECGDSPLKWRSMIRDNAIRRLRDEFVAGISSVVDVDALDVETIFLCTTEVSKA